MKAVVNSKTRNTKGKSFLWVFMFLFSAAHAQMSSYTFSSSATVFTAVTGGNLVRSNVGCPPASDQNYVNNAIGFSFIFNGTPYTTVGINSNGFLWFGTGLPSPSESMPISDNGNLLGSGIIDGVIAPLARNLKPRVISPCGEMRTETSGTAGSRVFTVQYLNWRGTSLGANPVYNFQVKLYETTNNIEIVYGAFIMSGASAGTCQVGIRGASNTDFSNRNISSDWQASAAGASNIATAALSSTAFPTNGLTYTWSPLSFTPCTNPPVAGAAASSADSVCTGGSFNLSLTGNTTGLGQTYQWQSSSDNINFTTISGATNASLSTTETNAMYYRCEISCGGSIATSASKFVRVKKWINCYCSSGATNTTDDDIGNVMFGTLNNGTANPVSNNAAAIQFYTDFTNLPEVTVNQGSSYPLSVSQISYGTFYPCWINVFIDYNRDGVFDSYTERIFSGQTATGSGNNTVSSMIDIPTNSSLGNTRMRIVLVEGGSANNSPCSAYSWGETEDYLLNITPALPLNVGALALASPQAGSCFSASEQVIVTVKNFGSNTLNFANTPMTVTCSVSETSTTTFPAITINTGSLAPFTAQNVLITNSYNMSSTGNYTFSATATIPGDGNTQNDAMPDQKRNTSTALSLPQASNFTGYSGTNLSSAFSSWHEASGTIPIGTASNWAAQNNMGAIGNVSARVNLFSNTNSEWIVSDNILIESNSTLKFSVAVTHWNSVSQPDSMGSDDAVMVRVSTDCGSTWSNLMTINRTASLSNQLAVKTISLAPYSGQEVKIAFYATDGSIDDANDYDFHIDDILISSTSITGTEKIERTEKLEMSVYPNPTQSNNINFSVSAGNHEEFLVVLLDVLGNMVYSKVLITSDNGQFAKAINPRADLPKGVYYVVGYFSDKSLSKKLIIE